MRQTYGHGDCDGQEIHTFAHPYGYLPRQAQSMAYLCDELLLPLLYSGDPGAETVRFRFVAGENGDAHTALIAFPQMDCDPLSHSALDTLNHKLLQSFPQSLSSQRNGDGAWEVRAVI